MDTHFKATFSYIFRFKLFKCLEVVSIGRKYIYIYLYFCLYF